MGNATTSEASTAYLDQSNAKYQLRRETRPLPYVQKNVKLLQSEIGYWKRKRDIDVMVYDDIFEGVCQDVHNLQYRNDRLTDQSERLADLQAKVDILNEEVKQLHHQLTAHEKHMKQCSAVHKLFSDKHERDRLVHSLCKLGNNSNVPYVMRTLFVRNILSHCERMIKTE